MIPLESSAAPADEFVVLVDVLAEHTRSVLLQRHAALASVQLFSVANGVQSNGSRTAVGAAMGMFHAMRVKESTSTSG